MSFVCVFQYLEFRVVRLDLRIHLFHGFQSYHGSVRSVDFYTIVRPQLVQINRVLLQCGLNVCFVEFFDRRKIRSTRVTLRHCQYSTVSREQADAKTCEKRQTNK